MKNLLLAGAAPISAGSSPRPQSPKAEQTARSSTRPRDRAARRQRTSGGAQRDALGGGEDAAGVTRDDEEGEVDRDAADYEEPDTLVADPQVCREFRISAMTLWRWDRDPRTNFPARIVLGKRNYRSRKQLGRFKAGLLRQAVVRRAREARG
jgi:hypothetical protein